MIEEHLDPTTEAHAHISNLLRTVITAAAGTAEKRAQRRQQELQETQRQTEEVRRALNDRLTAERQAAELVYRRVYQDSWWERARPQDIAGAVEAAGTWAASDPRANDALSHIGEQLQDRYGVDLADLYRQAQDQTTVPRTVADQVADIERANAKQSDTKAVTSSPADKPTTTTRTTVRWEAEVIAAAGPSLACDILSSEGWRHLQARLDQLDRSGQDVTGRLRQAISARELNSALDKGVALAWRLKTEPGETATARHGAHARRQAAQGSPPPGTPGKRGSSARTANRFAQKRKTAENQRDTGPGPEAAAS